MKRLHLGLVSALALTLMFACGRKTGDSKGPGGDGDGDGDLGGAPGDGDGDIAGDGDGDIAGDGDGDITGDGDGDLGGAPGDGDGDMGGSPPSSSCGDGNLDLLESEQCDDGNQDNGDGCDDQCHLEPLGKSCGDDNVDALEKCDPPDDMPADGDGCNATCNLTGKVTSIGAVTAASFTSDNDHLYFGISDPGGVGCGIAMIDVDDCNAAPNTAACQPQFIAGGAGMCTPANSNYADGDSSTATYGWMGTMGTDGSRVWFSEQQSLREVDLATGDVTTVAGQAGSCAAIDGNGTNALFNGMRGVTYYDGLVYLLDDIEAVLRQYDPASGDVTTIAGTRVPDKDVTQMAPYTCGPGGNNSQFGGGGPVAEGTGLGAVFDSPRYMTPDYNGNLYIIDTNGNAIVKYDIATTEMTILIQGTTGNSVPYVDGSAAAVTLSRPRGITSDGTSLYFFEQHHGTIRQLDLTNNSMTTFVGTQLCNTTPSPTDGTGALTGNGSCPSIGSVATVPIFNHQTTGAFGFHFATQSLYVVDVDTLRRVE